MVRRCTDPKNIGWAYYGGRGIRVCERWLNSFENFLADMGRTPGGDTGLRHEKCAHCGARLKSRPRYSLGRIDPDGNYEPGNCKWETHKEQIRNRRPFSEWEKWETTHPLYGHNYRKS
jgi:hypothetical protein